MRPLVLAALTAAVTGLTGTTAHAAGVADRCPGSAAVQPGAQGSAFYRTVAPFEHADSGRSQVFAKACALAELPAGDGVGVRRAPGDYATPYALATRGRDELVAYGYGSDAVRDGAYVALLDAGTLKERWRTTITDDRPKGQWSYPGVMAVLGDGAIVAVYGNRMVRLDPATGAVQARGELPEDPKGTGAAYNGFVVLPDGTIVLKNVERGPCPLSLTDEGPAAFLEALGGLFCSNLNRRPTMLVTVEPRTLKVLDAVQTPQPVTGRATVTRRAGVDLVYVAGADALVRYRVRAGKLELDQGWGPVVYRTGRQMPATGPGILGDWVVVQPNFLPSTEPLELTAVHQDDPTRIHRLRPFADVGADVGTNGSFYGFELLGAGAASLLKPVVDPAAAAYAEGGGPAPSWIVSKPALDAENRMIVAHDTAAGAMAGIRLDDKAGLKLAWRRPLRSLSFSALTGPAACRDVVITDFSETAGDQAVWLDGATGRELRRSRALDLVGAPGNIVTPGFDGRFFYGGFSGGLFELTPGGVARPGGCARPPAPVACRSRRTLDVTFLLRRGERLRSATVRIGKRTVRATVRGRRVRIDLRGLPRGTVRVLVTARTSRRTIAQQRTLRTCTPRPRA